MKLKKLLSAFCASTMTLFCSTLCCTTNASNPIIKATLVGDSRSGKTLIRQNLDENTLPKNDVNHKRRYSYSITAGDNLENIDYTKANKHVNSKRRCSTNSVGYTPTVGVDFINIQSENKRIQIWDTPGAINLRFILPTYLRNTDIAVICINISDYNYVKQLDYWLDYVTASNPNAHKIIVLTKTTNFSNNIDSSEAKNDISSMAIDPTIPIISCCPEIEDGIDALKERLFSIAETRQQQIQSQSAPQFQPHDAPSQKMPRWEQTAIFGGILSGGGIIGYGIYKAYEHFTSNGKDKNMDADNLKDNPNPSRVIA